MSGFSTRTNHRTSFRMFAAAILLLGLLSSVTVAASAGPGVDSAGPLSSAQQAAPAIHLKSRTFTPAPGVDPALRSTLGKLEAQGIGSAHVYKTTRRRSSGGSYIDKVYPGYDKKKQGYCGQDHQHLPVSLQRYTFMHQGFGKI